MKFENVKTIKEYILSKVSEEQIFAYYLDIPISDIITSLNNSSYRILNKHRYEENPSLRFVNRTKLKTLDYGSRIWSGDCFQIAGNVLRKNCNDRLEFMYILNHIVKNMINQNIQFISTELPKTDVNRNLTEINILIKPFSKFDYNFYNKYNIRNESIINTFAVENYWINNELNKYNYSTSDPCYAYYIGKIKNIILWKLYFPFRKKGVRFITNNKLCIENIIEIKGNRILILTKSKKDEFLLKQIFKDLNISIVDVYSLLSETAILTDEIYKYLKDKYKCIVTLLDNDTQGKEATNLYINKYNICPYFLVGQLEQLSKDITDTSRDKGYNFTVELVKEGYNNLINTL